MIDEIFAKRFAADWINAWNAHDLEAALSHYDDDFELASPAMVQLQVASTGHLRGKAAVLTYWQKALQRIPDLRFELISVLVGVQSITIHYKGVQERLASEVFFFNTEGKVSQAVVHYGPSC